MKIFYLILADVKQINKELYIEKNCIIVQIIQQTIKCTKSSLGGFKSFCVWNSTCTYISDPQTNSLYVTGKYLTKQIYAHFHPNSTSNSSGTACQDRESNCTDYTSREDCSTLQLPCTPVKFHYIFNLRDLSRIYEGLCRSKLDKFQTKESFIRLWRNEITRVFVDHLINDQDRDVISVDKIPSLIREHFSNTIEYAIQDPMLFGYYLTANPLDADVVDPKLYEDCEGFEKVGQKLKSLLQDYNKEVKEMNLEQSDSHQDMLYLLAMEVMVNN